ncbi:MAG TPA: hypothetical protein VLL08_05920, partial [Kineosporiaceae bacterium]|nr:hypothetical protein [Kineosporiaceae bacterium]
MPFERGVCPDALSPAHPVVVSDPALGRQFVTGWTGPDAPDDDDDDPEAELLAEVAQENASGFGLVQDMYDHAKTISWCEAQRLILIARLYDLAPMNPLPPPPAAL